MKQLFLAATIVVSSVVSATAFPALQGTNDGVWSSPIIAVLTDAETQRCNTLKAELAYQVSEIEGLSEEMGELHGGDKANAQMELDKMRSDAERIDDERVVINCPAD